MPRAKTPRRPKRPWGIWGIDFRSWVRNGDDTAILAYTSKRAAEADIRHEEGDEWREEFEVLPLTGD